MGGRTGCRANVGKLPPERVDLGQQLLQVRSGQLLELRACRRARLGLLFELRHAGQQPSALGGCIRQRLIAFALGVQPLALRELAHPLGLGHRLCGAALHALQAPAFRVEVCTRLLEIPRQAIALLRELRALRQRGAQVQLEPPQLVLVQVGGEGDAVLEGSDLRLAGGQPRRYRRVPGLGRPEGRGDPVRVVLQAARHRA